MLSALRLDRDAWRQTWPPGARQEIRQLLGAHVTYRLNRRLRTLPYVVG
jgi:hypothetical protein